MSQIYKSDFREVHLEFDACNLSLQIEIREHFKLPISFLFWLIWPNDQLHLCVQAVVSSSLLLASLVSSVYNTPGHMVNASEFMCGIYTGILMPLMHFKLFGQLAFLWHLRGIFVAGTYFVLLLW